MSDAVRAASNAVAGLIETWAAAKAAVAAAFADDAKVWRDWKRAVEALGDAGGADRVADLALRELALR